MIIATMNPIRWAIFAVGVLGTIQTRFMRSFYIFRGAQKRNCAG